MTRRRAIALWACAALPLIALTRYLEPPRQSLGWLALFDAGHVPLFGLFALFILHRLRASALAAQKHLLVPSRYWLAFGISVTLGALSEGLQAGSNHNPSFKDFAHDAAGAGAFLLLAAVRDPHVLGGKRLPIRAACGAVALALLALALAPGARVASAYLGRAMAFPKLCDFEGAWESSFVRTKSATLEYVSTPGVDGREAPAARITFAATPFPGFRVIDPYPDWSGYESLRVEIRSELEAPVTLVIRIHDRAHNGRLEDRFNWQMVVQPGMNDFAIPLADIRTAPAEREMDMQAIVRVSLYAVEPREPFALDLLALRLE